MIINRSASMRSILARKAANYSAQKAATSVSRKTYQMWLTHDNENEKLTFPVLPEKISVKFNNDVKNVSVINLGDLLYVAGRKACTITWSSFFPVTAFTGMNSSGLLNPQEYVNKIRSWMTSKKPSHFLLTGAAYPTNMYVLIDSFQITEEGGDVGTINYTITLKEYRNIKVRQIEIEVETETATVDDTEERVDDREEVQTYTVKDGDCLYNIAKALLGDGNRWKEIYELNTDIIKNANLIYTGWVLKIPTS